MDNKHEILENLLEVFLSAKDDFSINTRRHGNSKAYPRWYAHDSTKDLNKLTNLKIRTYKGSLTLDENNIFEFKIDRYDRYFDFLRRKRYRSKFKCVVSKVDIYRRNKHGNSRAVEITFNYDKNESQDVLREIFNFLEDRNDFDLNHIEILKAINLKKKTDECVDILSKSIGKRRKRENNINDILNDED